MASGQRLTDGQRAAARAVELRMVELGFNITTLSEGVGHHRDTVSDFVRGRRWPNPETRVAVETFLGWEAGHTAELAEKYEKASNLSELAKGDVLAQEVLASNISDDKKRILLAKLWDKDDG